MCARIFMLVHCLYFHFLPAVLTCVVKLHFKMHENQKEYQIKYFVVFVVLVW